MLPLYDDRPARRFPFATLLVIAVNAVVFFWQLHADVGHSVDIGSLVPTAHQPWHDALLHMATSMFLHAGWLHLIG
ncbi:MAG TPA: rhomboid family intramembrane serine protease, partial [Chthoniobacteraceae bacterium]|nr:rhomboid family intramembrane serine protease [Chthoniobacteraceae bacterium]